jgi:hypothetical protein
MRDGSREHAAKIRSYSSDIPLFISGILSPDFF